MTIIAGCDYCNDLRNVEPARYISFSDADCEANKELRKLDKEKKFIHHFIYEGERIFEVVEKCPICEIVFTDEMYDNYI